MLILTCQWCCSVSQLSGALFPFGSLACAFWTFGLGWCATRNLPSCCYALCSCFRLCISFVTLAVSLHFKTLKTSLVYQFQSERRGLATLATVCLTNPQISAIHRNRHSCKGCAPGAALLQFYFTIQTCRLFEFSWAVVRISEYHLE